MNKSIPNGQKNETQPAPKGPSIISLLTENIIKILVDAAISGFFLYFIWNFTLSVELHLQQLSYLFFACAALFCRILLYKPSEAVIISQLYENNSNLNQLIKITSFGIAVNNFKNSEDVLNIIGNPSDNTTKKSENTP